jgi:hypothetical protein
VSAEQSAEQLARDVADIRVHTAETAIRVRAIARDGRGRDRRMDELTLRVAALEKWRYTIAGVVLAVGVAVQLLIATVVHR